MKCCRPIRLADVSYEREEWLGFAGDGISYSRFTIVLQSPCTQHKQASSTTVNRSRDTALLPRAGVSCDLYNAPRDLREKVRPPVHRPNINVEYINGRN